MNIDIRTLYLMICISSFLQAIAIATQSSIFKRYGGTGWWVRGSSLTALGIMMVFLRDLLPGKFLSIFLANSFLLLGALFVYVGIIRFMGRKEKKAVLVFICLPFLVFFSYYTYVRDDLTARTVVISAALALINFMIAKAFWDGRSGFAKVTCIHMCGLFLVYGIFMTVRAVATSVLDPVASLFTPTAMQIITFLVLFAYINLVTYGLILLLGQRANAEIQEAKEHFELVFNTIPDATIVTRLSDGLIVEVSDGFTENTGHTRAEIEGKSTLDINLWENPDERRKAVEELREHGLCRNRDVIYRRKDNSTLRGSMSAVLFPVRDEMYFLSVTRDISDRIEAEEKIRRLNSELESKVVQRTAELETSNRELEGFASALSHDLRTPLRAINGYSKILIDDHAEKLDDEAMRLLSAVRSGTQRMDSMMSDLLRFAGLAAERLRYERIDMTSLAMSIFDEVMLETFPDSVRCPQVRLTLPTLDDAWADRNLTAAVWYHLIENAVKFTRTKNDRSIGIGCNRQGDMVEYFVKDNGVGFNPGYIPKLFGLFERLHSPAEFEGTGAGLAIVKRIVERHGGRVRAEANPDAGATMYFSLPLYSHRTPRQGGDVS